MPERLTRVIVRCLAPEDGQGSGSAGQCETSRPLYGIRRKASKVLFRQGRVLQNPHTWVQIPPSPLGNTRQRQATPDSTSWGPASRGPRGRPQPPAVPDVDSRWGRSNPLRRDEFKMLSRA